MCGIAGLISTTLPQDSRRLKLNQMLACISHRGPDSEGVWENLHISLGHKRLSIIDLSPKANQPMSDESGNTLVFNGMIYNYKELRKELTAFGFSFNSASDTEVLLKGYTRWGEEVLKKIRGFFSFALYDPNNNKIICARDPFGKKPFYYFYSDRQFLFSSEIQSLVSALDKGPPVNYNDLSYYLWKGYFPYSSTVYENIYTLKPGHAVALDLNGFKLKKWEYQSVHFDLGTSQTEEPLDYCSGLIEDSVKKRLQSDVPLGVLLSGGVDSSLVSLFGAEASPSKINTFNISFSNKTFDESVYAQKIAKNIESHHRQIKVENTDMKELLGRLVRVYGEPFGDTSSIPTYKVFEAMKPYAKVALTGDGGDEVFAGYVDVKIFLLRKLSAELNGFRPVFGDNLIKKLVRNPSRNSRWLGYLLMGLQKDGSQTYSTLFYKGWTDYWRKNYLRSEIWNKTGEDKAEKEDKHLFMQGGGSDLERYLNRNMERLSQAFLVKTDRASMAHSIETRSPFLDLDLFNFTRVLSPKQLLKKWKTKYILKSILDKKMGYGFSNRPKMGFTPPLEEWMNQKDTFKWIQSNLTHKNSFAYSLIEPGKVNYLLKQHQKDHQHTERIWHLLFLNEWHCQYGS